MGISRWLRRGTPGRRDPLAGARHVVVLGGGTGMSTALRGLKRRGLRITAIVSMADDGGSSGVLRERLGIPPVGDLRNCLIALADAEPTAGVVLQHRLPTEAGSTRGHPIGNLLLAAAIAEEGGDLERGVERVHRILQVRGRVVPATAIATRLRGRTRSGVIIHGQAALARTRGIAGVELEPTDVAATPSAVEAIRTADLLVLGPGSLYTSVIPHLLVPGIRIALVRRRAPLVWVANVDEQEGETEGMDLEAHVEALYAHGGDGVIDAILAAAPLRGRRREQIGTPVHPAYRDEEGRSRPRELPPLIVRDIISRLRPHLHDAARLGAAIDGLHVTGPHAVR